MPFNPTRSRRPPPTEPWADEFRRQLDAIASLPAQIPAVEFTGFGPLADRLARNQLTWPDVRSEVLRGIFNISPMGTDSRGWPRYQMTTHSLELRLHSEPWNHNPRVRLGVLDGAWPRKGRPSEWHVPLVPAAVTLREPAKGVHLDLDRLATYLKKRRWAAEAERTLTRVVLTPRRHAALRAEVRRQYGSLRALMELARQRAEAGDVASGAGVVLDGRRWFGPGHLLADELVIRLDKTVTFPGGEGCQLAVWPDLAAIRKPDQLPLVQAADDVVVLALPDATDQAARLRRLLPPGTRAVVSETGDFRYRRHVYALRKFLDEEEVTGNWTSLATLLCAPENLAAPRNLPEITPRGRPLNHEQRQAVASALTTPHAHFIQGPPGTGKTQVITDLASRLAGRGERVLLTAPTHVAVDEVLRRLADEPGVLPLRLSWKDNLVDSEVRRFTKSGYDSMLAASVRTPATSKIAQWEAQLSKLSSYRTALTDWQAVTTDYQAAQQALTAAQTAKQQNDALRQTLHNELDTRHQQALQLTSQRAAELAALDAEQQALAARLATVEPARGWLARLADRAGLGPVSRIHSAQHRLSQAQATAASRHAQAAQDLAERQQQRQQAKALLTRQEENDAAHVANAEKTAAELMTRADQAQAELTAHGAGHLRHDPAELTRQVERLASEIHHLNALCLAQRRWFELLGLTGTDEAADRERARTVVGRALTSAVNLVCSTTAGFGGDREYRDLDYDTLIVDEASKVTGAEFLIPAGVARRWILVGDEKQLSPYVPPDDEHHMHALAAIHLTYRHPELSLDDAAGQLADLWRKQDETEQHPFRVKNVASTARRLLSNGTWHNAHQAVYAEQISHIAGDGEPERRLLAAMNEHLVTSIFERCVAEIGTGLRSQLIYQRRMTPQIAELVRCPVYAGDYRTPDPPEPDSPRPLVSRLFPTPVMFLDTSLQPDPWQAPDPSNQTSFINELEATWVNGVCRQWERELRSLAGTGQISVSVLAFYSGQTKLIRRKLGHPRYQRFPQLNFKVVDSVDRIQGQQSDLVIISFCRTFPPRPPRRRFTGDSPPPPDGYARWLQNINRLNVACTRARRSLILIGHQPTLRRLSGVPAAQGFYSNLFNLPPDCLTVRSDWLPEPAKGRR